MVDFSITNGDNGFPTPDNSGEVLIPTTVTSPLESLKKRREKLMSDLYVDIRVPRWDDPEIYVRFKPVSAIKLGAAVERRRKQKGDDWSLLANADMLVEACIGIYAVVDGDLDNKLSLKSGNPDGKWTRFDPDLAEAIGVEAERAVDSCIALYMTEGDLLDTANRLFRWSNIAGDEADEAF